MVWIDSAAEAPVKMRSASVSSIMVHICKSIWPVANLCQIMLETLSHCNGRRLMTKPVRKSHRVVVTHKRQTAPSIEEVHNLDWLLNPGTSRKRASHRATLAVIMHQSESENHKARRLAKPVVYFYTRSPASARSSRQLPRPDLRRTSKRGRIASKRNNHKLSELQASDPAR